MLRVVHVGLGPLGQRVAADLEDRGVGEVVAAVDLTPDHLGKPLHEVAEGARSATTISNQLDAALDQSERIDAVVVTTTSDASRAAETIRPCLVRGLPVVTTCEEMLYPWLRHAVLSSELDSLAKQHGGRLLGTGINPGYLMDLFPVVATGVCREVAGVRVTRIQDATTRRIPFQQKIGAGLDLDTFERKRQEGTLRHVGLGESLFLLAGSLGWTIETWDETLEPVIAQKELSCGLGPIPAGNAAGVRQIARGKTSTGEELELEFVAAIGQDDPHDRVEIDGTPPVNVVFEGGIHGDISTSAVTINTLPRLIEAPAGLHTMASIAPVRWFAGTAALTLA